MENHDEILENARTLICEQDFNKITVKMICEKSNISRKTFYAAYQDKYDVLERIILKDIVEELDYLLDTFGRIKLERSIILEALYKKIYAHKEFYLKAFNMNGSELMETYFMKNLIKLDYKILEIWEIPEIEREYAAYFYAGAQVMLIKKWISNGFDVSPEKMAEYYRKWAVSSMLSNYAGSVKKGK